MDNIMITDNVFTSYDAQEIIRVFDIIDKKKSCNGYYSFERYKEKKVYSNSIEYIINDYLTKINDDSRYVEYWGRNRWINVPCHKDLDEQILECEDRVESPISGNVLYLNEESKEAATILFNEDETKLSLAIPKIGRALRFKGDLYHYVPSPFISIFNGEAYNVNTDRSVLLFNTWSGICPVYSTPKVNSRKLICNDTDEWFKVLEDEIETEDDIRRIYVPYMGEKSRLTNNINLRIFETSKKIQKYMSFEYTYGHYFPTYNVKKVKEIEKR